MEEGAENTKAVAAIRIKEAQEVMQHRSVSYRLHVKVCLGSFNEKLLVVL